MKIVLIANTAWNLWNFRQSLLQRLHAEGFELLCLAPEDGYAQLLSNLPGVRFVPLHHLSRKGLSPFANWWGFWEIYRQLRRERPGLVVPYTIKPNVFGCMAAHWLGIPCVATIEGLGYAATASALLRNALFGLYRLALRRARKVVFLNHDDERVFLEKNIVSPDKTLIINGTGVDTDYFHPQGHPPQRPVFLFIGRLLSDKGIREFVQAAEMVRARQPECRFQVLGNPDEGNPASIAPSELERWVGQRQIEYLGYADDVRPFIAAATAVVLPSYREGMPRVLLEGLAMGKPIVTTDSVGCRETVDEGQNGYIVPAESAPALAEALQNLLTLPSERLIAMGHHSRQKALERFSNQVILKQYLDVFRSACRP